MRVTPALSVYLLVAIGAVAGGLLRYLIAVGGLVWSDFDFPWPTLLANALGSLVIGWLHAGMVSGRLRLGAAPLAGLMAGFCGSLTTFSIFSFECLLLVESGQAGLAAAYVLVSAAVWMGAVWAGFRLGFV